MAAENLWKRLEEELYCTLLYCQQSKPVQYCIVQYSGGGAGLVLSVPGGGGGGESPGHQLGPALHDEVDSHVGVAGREVVHLGREPSLPSPQSCWHTFRSFGIGSSFHGPVWRRYHRAGLTVW